MIKKALIAITVISLLAGSTAWAGVKKRTPGVNKRQHRQGHRIHQGVRSGELTRDEAKELRTGQKEVRQMKREAKSDGVVTREERKELHRKQNEESKEIYQEKHDTETR